jgi:hypothetical protein
MKGLRMSDIIWQQSSYCGNGGNNCIQVAVDGNGISIRESVEPDRTVSAHRLAFRSFVTRIKAGDFDRLLPDPAASGPSAAPSQAPAPA